MSTFCAHRLFYSFTTSDGSEGATAGHLVSPRYIMVSEVLLVTYLLLVACQGDVLGKLNLMFLLVDSFNSNFYC